MKKKALVIGAGLAGMSAAIRLTADGYDVKIIEKNSNVGGKLNRREGKGFTFDTGPSILTMPWVLEQLFSSVHRRIEDYITIERIEPQWRTFFEDGVQLDVTSDLPTMIDEMKKVSGNTDASISELINYSEKMYDLCMKSFYKYSLADLKDLKKYHTLKDLMSMDPLNTVAEGTKKKLNNKHLEQLFNFFVMYVGSNPYQAPAILNQLIYVQLGLGIHYVKGGMYNIAIGMKKLLDELRVDVQLNSPVDHLVFEGKTVTGVRTTDGTLHEADIVVSNLEAIPAYRNLVPHKEGKKEAKKLNKTFVPSVSGLVLLLGVDRQFTNLKHHNFFFSEDPEKEFSDIFEKGIPSDDPTVYVGISSRSDDSQAPAGKDNLFVLTHVPPLKEGDQGKYDWAEYRELVLDKLERMGAKGLRDSIEFEYRFTPEDLEELYGPNGGSIYGIASDKKKNGGFKIPAKSELYENLYFVGGSTHPGGGVPMVTLSGQLTADLIKRNEEGTLVNSKVKHA
ncbi:NAD(P)/FAD-dependent oxidoreductase [Jeotgalibacillus sp. R-1-5s-1]|uniref:phytoene desaturase family protein n=1 Tax=Jeotgalibacillus sp. R-1-5s-1 TaxID=2555897 RepID=UPI00106ACB26|nr:phytoene desaturase family protein [Jeotgalibacillus sp. R-1-5s-1]TFE02515.1 phytoene desaturase [Jeotgalibacillus sp. R-1-5s-1]